MAQVNCGQTKELYNNREGRHKAGTANTGHRTQQAIVKCALPRDALQPNTAAKQWTIVQSSELVRETTYAVWLV